MSSTIPTSQQERELAAAALDHTFELDGLTFDRDLALAGLVREVRERLRLNDDSVIERRMAFIDQPEARPEEFGEAVIELDPGGFVLAGIRWFGGDRSQPFIDAWPSIPLREVAPTSDRMRTVTASLVEHFRRFEPRHLLVWSRPGEWPPTPVPTSGTGGLADVDVQLRSQYWIGEVTAILAAPDRSVDARLELRPLVDDSYFEWYEATYRALHEDHPEMRRRVEVNDRETMRRSVDDELLFEIRVDGERAGLIAGVERELLGRSGAYFVELLLTSGYRGRGLAPLAQRRFIEHVEGRVDFVWGTIDAGNHPSRRTARRVGRRMVREECFFRLAPDNSLDRMADLEPLG